MTEQEEADLIARIIVYDDHKAFEVLILKYQSDIRALLFKLTLADASTVDDLTQEVFIRVYKYLKSYQSKSKFYTWLYRITYNVFLEDREKKKKRTTLNLGKVQISTFNPNRQLDAEIDVNILLEGLKAEEKICIELAYLKGFSHSDIALVLDCPLGTVKTHIRRGKMKLLKQLKPEK